MIVVPVFMTSCHVSLNAKIGPVTIQTAITATASTKVLGRPQKREADLASPEYHVAGFMRGVSFWRLTCPDHPREQAPVCERRSWIGWLGLIIGESGQFQ